MITDRVRAFKAQLKKQSVIGPFSKTSDPALIEAIGYSGFDFVVLDLEHGPNSVQTLQNLIRACQVSGLFPIVRVKENPVTVIGEVLDVGVGGIQVPQITNADEAHRIIRLAKFAPDGMRGVCRYVRAADYSSAERFKYFKEANETLVILQLEGKQALDNIDEILEVPGIDILFIGPYDLAQSLNVPGEVDHPLVTEMTKKIVEKSSKHDIVIGTFMESVENARNWERLGIGYLCYSVDVGLFTEKCRETVAAFRK